MVDSLSRSAFVGTNNPSSNLSNEDLLRQLGVRGMKRLAGFIPLVSEEALPEPAAEDEMALCDEATANQFIWLIKSSFNGLRATWLLKFAETDQRLPDELLPVLMDSYRSRFGTPSYLLDTVGNRARWLAEVSQNYQWRWFNSERSKDTKSFSLGTRFGRHAEYRQLRQDEPEQAQIWLDKHWPYVSFNDRLNIVKIIRENLQDSDLSFLKAQTRWLDEEQEAETLQEIWYMLSLLKPETFADMIQEILQVVDLDYMGQGCSPVLDFCWSNSFLGKQQYIKRDAPLKLIQQYPWANTIPQLIRLVPLDYWLGKWRVSAEDLLNGARQGLNSDIFIPLWLQRAIDEGHEFFALGILRHQHPQVNRFGWYGSKQSKLLNQLSFKSLQTLLDEVWMNPAMEATWQIIYT
jgi:hypothetical protein